MFKNCYRILSLLIATLLLTSCVQQKVQTDYLQSALSSNPDYFDGTWTGDLRCAAAGTAAWINERSVTIKNREGVWFQTGKPNTNGWVDAKLKISPAGEVKVSGHYYWDQKKYINISGQVGKDPEDSESGEVMMLQGTRGPRSCTAKLYRNVEEPKKEIEVVKAKDTTAPKVDITSHAAGKSPVITTDTEVKVTGKVSDNDPNLVVTVNDTKVKTDSQGAFLHQVPLQVGDNSIVIKAVDSEGNTGLKKISVKREVPKIAPPVKKTNYTVAAPAKSPVKKKSRKKEKLAVLDLEPKYGIEREYAEALSVILRDQLYNAGDFAVLSQEDIRAVVTREQVMQAVGSDDGSDRLVSFGRTLGTRYLVAGGISKIGNRFNLSLRMLDTRGNSAGLVSRVNEECSCSEEDLIAVVKSLAYRLIDNAYLPEK